MARIISSVTHSDEIRNRGERETFKALQQGLASHFLVFYSVNDLWK